jgi:hypothetical protein
MEARPEVSDSSSQARILDPAFSRRLPTPAAGTRRASASLSEIERDERDQGGYE